MEEKFYLYHSLHLYVVFLKLTSSREWRARRPRGASELKRFMVAEGSFDSTRRRIPAPANAEWYCHGILNLLSPLTRDSIGHFSKLFQASFSWCMTRKHSGEPLEPIEHKIERLFRHRGRVQRANMYQIVNQGIGQQEYQNVEAIPNVGNAARPHVIRDHLNPILDGSNLGIVAPEIQATHFELKLVMFNMLNSIGQFGGIPHENVRQHIRNILEVKEVKATNSACLLCHDNHHESECPTNQESTNYVGNYNRGNNNPYSNTYNPGWRQHSNFSWENQGTSNTNQPVGQIVAALQERQPSRLSSDTEVTKAHGNEQCIALTLRSGTQINVQDKFGGRKNDDLPHVTVPADHKVYHAHQYTNGTLCDLTNQPRETEVRFVCSEPRAMISSITELSTCKYTLTIQSPMLCKHPKFR
ncbi:hypothetical protein F3Y22_tig00006396pilonHSYRG00002 [Hibiscus syriacus]|uniref:MRH domain-containing protein n=1 Tax=Hibiscus syriacus TaxID=106335 RepID=A0A6A3CD72_HIBSY|nr:hypothetical protein F3Y22_tig00006396pilonHSYRG00002 [Hibiscus syriacus]